MTLNRGLTYPALVLEKFIKVLPFDFRNKAFGKFLYDIAHHGHMALQFDYIHCLAWQEI